MSYNIISGIKIDEKTQTVWIKGAESNVIPRIHTWSSKNSLTDKYRAQGKEQAIKDILRAYWSGDFQGGNNLFNKSVQYAKLTGFPMNWSNTGRQEEIGQEKWGGATIEYSYQNCTKVLYEKYQEFLNRDMSYYWYIELEPGKYVVKVSKRSVWHAYDPDHAKRFPSYEGAVIYASKIDQLGDKENDIRDHIIKAEPKKKTREKPVTA